MEYSLWHAALVVGVAFLGSIVGGVSGYGVGLILPPVLAPMVGVAKVIPVMAVGMALTNLSRVVAYRREVVWQRTLQLLLLGLPASFLGAWAYTMLTGRAIAVLLGVFLVIVVPLRRWLKTRKFVLGPFGLTIAGGLHGVLAGAMSGSGLLQIAALMAAGVEGGGLIGTDATVSCITNVVKIVMFTRAGLLDPALIAIGLMIGVVSFPGAFLARAILRRLPIKLHTAMMDALVILGGLSFLWRGIRG